ncbi:MAG: DUF3147 family protein [bacterium]
MQYMVKLLISLCIIFLATWLGKKLPSLAGLIATMPLTGVIVLLWLYSENKDNYNLLTKYTTGALWGILPSILFFLTAFICFKKQIPFPFIIILSFSVWIIGAFVHQMLLR